jgi:imidazolonepropionase
MSVRPLLLVKNAAQVAAVSLDPAVRVKCGKAAQDAVDVVENGCVVVGSDGKIAFVGTADELKERYPAGVDAERELDLKGESCVLPGLVDGHTHPVWSGDRVHEFAMKLAGASYLDVHKAGGGIGFTVGRTRESSEEELLGLLRERLDVMLSHGSTTVEAKSGYGLDTETEMKMLRVIGAANKEHPIELVSTYCAHAVPAGHTEAEATKDVLEKQLPELIRLRDNGELSVENVDVFLETGVFEYDSSRAILEAGSKAGFELNFHGDELSATRAGELAGDLGALGVSHLEFVDDAGIAAMAKRPTAAVLLPTTAYVLRLVPPPARKFIDAGVPVALGTDFCPNAHCLSLPQAMNLACVSMHMTMNEALVAATLNSAYSLNRGDTHGSLAVGKVGDLVIVKEKRWEHLVYQLGDPPVQSVFKSGVEVFRTPPHRNTLAK